MHWIFNVTPQHHKNLKDLNLWGLSLDDSEESVDDMSINMLTAAGMGDASILDKLLTAKVDPNVSDSRGKTALVSY